MPTFADRTAELEATLGHEQQATVASGEVAYLIQTEHGWGGLARAALQVRKPYKTIAGRARVIGYYEKLLPGRNLDKERSVAHELLEEFTDLTYTDLRTAMRLDRNNPWVALYALRKILLPDMSPERFAIEVQKERRRNGHEQTTYVVDNGRGLRITIERYA